MLAGMEPFVMQVANYDGLWWRRYSKSRCEHRELVQ